MNIKRTIAAILLFSRWLPSRDARERRKTIRLQPRQKLPVPKHLRQKMEVRRPRVLQPRRRPLPKRANIPNTILICPGLIGITGRFTKKEICPILRKPLKISQS